MKKIILALVFTLLALLVFGGRKVNPLSVGSCHNLDEMIFEIKNVSEESVTLSLRYFDETNQEALILAIMMYMLGNNAEVSLEGAQKELTKETLVKCSDYEDMMRQR